jgi:hypothetical protein
MQSPPLEWGLGIGYLVILDVLRDRGEPDGDTASEVVRVAFKVDRPEGRRVLAAVMVAGGIALYCHFVKPEMRPS